MLTKAAQVMALYDGVRSTNEIAEIVGCRPEYVRVVARQRKGRGMSDIDRRYVSSSLGMKNRERANQKSRAHRSAYYSTIAMVAIATGDKALANAKARQSYAAARLAGKSIVEARKLSLRVRQRTLYQTADREAARAAAREAYRASRASEAAC